MLIYLVAVGTETDDGPMPAPDRELSSTNDADISGVARIRREFNRLKFVDSVENL